MDEPLEKAIALLDGLIKLTKAHGLDESALFLDMAKLQLQLDLHGITDEEFAAFCDALENGTLTPGSVARGRGTGRPRRDGDLRAMRRAWQCPEGVPMPHRGGGRAK
jgi:hypothetical protein